MNLAGKRVLVTGAEGFIGSHLTEKLVAMGSEVKAFVLYNSFNSRGWLDTLPKDVRDQIHVFMGDIRDPFGVKEAMKQCDVVFHLAALIAIPYSYHSPSTYVETNVSGTLNVVQAARELSVKKVVHTSTSEVYGTAQYVPIDERHPLKGQSPYSASKIGADQIALSYYYSFQTPVSVIRPFNTYGPRQSLRAVIPTIISQIQSRNSVLKLGALSPTRDFNYISDTVNGFIRMAECDTSVGEVINIGSNFEVSILETAKFIMEIMNNEIPIQEEEIRRRPKDSEVERLWADNGKAMSILNWYPSYTGREGLKRGLEETIEWFTEPKNRNLYRNTDFYTI